MAYTFRHSMCNEAFEGRPFAEMARAIRAAGYTGIEIAPFTLAEKPSDISPAQRREYRDILSSEGLAFVGLHWLMVSPKGLHVTTPDAELRKRSWNHVRELIDLAADLGPGPVMVFGSPQQRSTTGGLTRLQATRKLVDLLCDICEHAEARQVTVLLEPLPISQSDVVQNLLEAVDIVREIASPAIQTMFDVHNAVDEVEPPELLIDRHFDYIRHIHVNELNGGHCGTNGYAYRPIFEVLARRRYTGWISLETFDFTPGAERIARESLAHLESVIQELS